MPVVLSVGGEDRLESRREGLDLRDQALAVSLGEPHVREAHDITIYEHDACVSVSLHLKMDPEVAIKQAHEVAERVESTLRQDPLVAERANPPRAARATHCRPL
jgi:hypothetical protein